MSTSLENPKCRSEPMKSFDAHKRGDAAGKQKPSTWSSENPKNGNSCGAICISWDGRHCLSGHKGCGQLLAGKHSLSRDPYQNDIASAIQSRMILCIWRQTNDCVEAWSLVVKACCQACVSRSISAGNGLAKQCSRRIAMYALEGVD